MTQRKSKSTAADKKQLPPSSRILIAISIGAVALAGFCFLLISPARLSPDKSASPAAQVAKKIVLAREKVHDAAVQSMNAGMQEFRRGDFAISYPKNWETADINIASTQMFHASTLGGIANLTITAAKVDEKDLESWTKTTISNLEYVSGPDASLLSVKQVSLNKTKGNQIIFEAQPEHVPSRVKQQLILVAVRGTGYTVALSSPVQYYPEFEKVFQLIVSSIRIGE